MVKLILLSFLFISNTLLADDECQYKRDYSGLIKVTRQPLGNICVVGIHPYKSENLKYRSYLFTSEGKIMIFNSYGEGPEHLTTGAREIFLFPRHYKNPDYKVLDDGYIQITLSNGRNAYFSPYTAELTKLDGALFKIKELSPNNDGGVEMTSYDQLRIDFGFKLGGSPMDQSYRKSDFIDNKGNRCRISNTEIVNYSGDEPALLDHSDDDLFQRVKILCPSLNL